MNSMTRLGTFLIGLGFCSWALAADPMFKVDYRTTTISEGGETAMAGECCEEDHDCCFLGKLLGKRHHCDESCDGGHGCGLSGLFGKCCHKDECGQAEPCGDPCKHRCKLGGLFGKCCHKDDCGQAEPCEQSCEDPCKHRCKLGGLFGKCCHKDDCGQAEPCNQGCEKRCKLSRIFGKCFHKSHCNDCNAGCASAEGQACNSDTGCNGDDDSYKVAQLLRILRTDCYAYKREYAASALDSFGCNPEIVDALVQALNDTNIDVRREAAESLGKLQCCDDHVVAALEGALNDWSREVRDAAFKSLAECGACAEPTRHLLSPARRTAPSPASEKVGPAPTQEAMRRHRSNGFINNLELGG